MHGAPPGQAVPHAPQLPLFDCRLTHALPHRVRPAAQMPGWHTPPAHTELPWQTLPHTPQLRGSFCRLVHVVPHCTWPTLHVQALLTQLAATGHCMPQPPQLSTSSVVFTQELEQLVVPAPHDTVHVPAEQSGVAAGHTLPQAPQFSESLWVGVQTPPHRIPWSGHTHALFSHCVPPVQRVPH